jgi:hypothetical protein
MASDDFLQRDMPEYGEDREYPDPRDADEDLPGQEADGEEGAWSPRSASA